MPTKRLQLIRSEGLNFAPENDDGSVHLHYPDKMQVHGRLQVLGKLDCANARVGDLQDVAGNNLLQTDTNKVTVASGTTFDFNNCAVSNLNIGGSATVQASAVQSNNGFASVDAELDSIQTTVNEVEARTKNLTANRVMQSNASGILVPSSAIVSDLVTKTDNTTQTLAGNVNLATGKTLQYDGNPIPSNSAAFHAAPHFGTTSDLAAKVSKATPTFTGLSDGLCRVASNVMTGAASVSSSDLDSALTSTLTNKLEKDLSNIGSSIVPEANVHSDIARVSAVATKLNADLSNIGSSVVQEPNLSTDVVRTTALTSALTNKLNTDLSNIGSSVVPAANVHTDIARASDFVPKTGGAFTGTLNCLGGFNSFGTSSIAINNSADIVTHTVSNNAFVSGTAQEYCAHKNCAFTTGTTFTGDVKLTNLTGSKTLVLDASKNITTTDSVPLTSAQLAKVNNLPADTTSDLSNKLDVSSITVAGTPQRFNFDVLVSFHNPIAGRGYNGSTNALTSEFTSIARGQIALLESNPLLDFYNTSGSHKLRLEHDSSNGNVLDSKGNNFAVKNGADELLKVTTTKVTCSAGDFEVRPTPSSNAIFNHASGANNTFFTGTNLSLITTAGTELVNVNLRDNASNVVLDSTADIGKNGVSYNVFAQLAALTSTVDALTQYYTRTLTLSGSGTETLFTQGAADWTNKAGTTGQTLDDGIYQIQMKMQASHVGSTYLPYATFQHHESNHGTNDALPDLVMSSQWQYHAINESVYPNNPTIRRDIHIGGGQPTVTISGHGGIIQGNITLRAKKIDDLV